MSAGRHVGVSESLKKEEKVTFCAGGQKELERSERRGQELVWLRSK